MAQRRLTVLILLTLLGLTLLARGPAVVNGYLNFDDQICLTDNALIRRGLSLEGVKFAFTDMQSISNWVPLTYVSYMIDMQLFGQGPFGPHLTNVLLSMANVVLLFFALRAMTGAVWRSGAAAALLAIHPIHTESIAWVAERRDVLSLFFGLLSLWAYAVYARRSHSLSLEGEGRGEGAGQQDFSPSTLTRPAYRPPSPSRERGRGWFYALALLAFYASLMSKAMLVTLPCVMLLLDYWPLGRRRAGVAWLVVEKLPFLAGTVAVSIVTAIAQRVAMRPLEDVPTIIHVVNMPVAYAWYLYRLVWPVELSPYYIYQLFWPTWIVVAAPTLLAGLSILAFLQRRRRPWLLVGWLWFLGSMVPVIGLVQVGRAAFACRYAYFPFIGLYVAIVWSLPNLATFPRRVAAGCVAAALAAVLVTASVIQDSHWKNNYSLFSYALAVSPPAAVPCGMVADSLQRAGDAAGALANYRRAVVLDPTEVPILSALINFHLERKEPLPAESLLRLGDVRNHDAPPILAGWGVLYLMKNQPDLAVKSLREAAALAPRKALYRYQLALALARAGDIEGALDANEQAVALDSENSIFWENYGLTFMKASRPPLAVQALQHAVKLDAGNAQAWSELAEALNATGQFDESLAANEQEVALKPDWAEAHNNLGTALARKGRIAEAAEQFKLAVRLKPDYADAVANLRRASALLQGPPASAP